MNLALTDPFILAQDYPEALTGKLSWFTVTIATSTSLIMQSGSGHATCLRFNRRGDFLASGRVRFNANVRKASILIVSIRLMELS